MDIWKHGMYIDLWSSVHLLSGVLLGIGCYWIGFSFLEAVVLTTLLLLAWELWEWLIGISEDMVNVALDIVIGVAGFFLAVYWHYFMGMPFDPGAAGVLCALTAVISLWGFSDLRIRGYR